jgi:hypothetical protein
MEFTVSNEWMEYNSRMSEVSNSKEIGISQKGFLGWLPSSTLNGDLICIPWASEVPYILRKGEDEYYKLVGDRYFHGIMHGEVLRAEDLVEREIKIGEWTKE